jgi:hypothetical protein
MNEEGPKPPELITEEAVILALDTNGIENAEAKALLVKYIEQCQAEADAEAAASPGNPEVSHRVNIVALVKIAALYASTKHYKNEALDALTEALFAACQDSSTDYLGDIIEQAIDEIKGINKGNFSKDNPSYFGESLN